MKKFLIFLFSLCSLASYAQEAVFSYGTDGQIIVDSTYIVPLYPHTEENKSKATELTESMEVSTLSGNLYTVKAFQIKDWDTGDFQYVKVYKDGQKIYELSNGNGWINFPNEYSGSSVPHCCYVANMGKDAVALIFHEMSYGSNLPNMTIIVLKDNQATLVYNRECSINEIVLPKQEMEISFDEEVPNCYTMDYTPCYDTRKLFISKDGIKISSRRTLQEDLCEIYKNLPFTSLPHKESKFTRHERQYGVDNTSGQIPNRLYENLQCTQYVLADENDLLPAAFAKFKTMDEDICMVAIHFGGATYLSTSVLITINANGEILDSLEVESGYETVYIKQFRILRDGKVIVTSIKPKQQKSIPYNGFKSFVGNRVDCTYRVERGKFILEGEHVFEEQTYEEELLEKDNFNLWYDNILEHPEFSLQEAKDAFQSRKESYQSSNRHNTEIGLPAGDFEPEWDRAIASVNPTRENLLYYTVPIKSLYQYKAVLLDTPELKWVYVYQKMLVMKSAQDNSVNFYLISLVPNLDFEERNQGFVAENFVFLKEDNNFSGVSIFSSLFSGLIIDSEQIINGRIIKRVFIPSREEEITERIATARSILQPYHFFRVTTGKGRVRGTCEPAELNWQKIKHLNTRK